MSRYTPAYEWEGHGFTSPRQVCAICGTDSGMMNRLFWAGTPLNGDDEYMFDLCQPHKKSHGKRMVSELLKGVVPQDVINRYKTD